MEVFCLEAEAKPGAAENSGRTTLPFEMIPGHSKLFLDFQSGGEASAKFFPHRFAANDPFRRRDQILAHYETDRNAICDALQAFNEGIGASQRSLENIRRLRGDDTVAVLTGQQAGVLSGPLYTVYKAFTAIKIADELTEKRIEAVPIFWMATEDHDLAEAAKTFGFNYADDLTAVSLSLDRPSGRPVGTTVITAADAAAIDAFLGQMPETSFSAEVRQDLDDIWHAGTTFGKAFARTLVKLAGKYGLIIVDPQQAELKHAAAPIYALAVKRSAEMVDRLMRQDELLAAAGFHSQVLVESDHFPLFYIGDDGTRHSLKRNGDKVRIKGTRTDLSLNEIEQLAISQPERLSPGVLLRPAVQDHLFPTFCYVGGAAEVAYFAQNLEVYRVLERPEPMVVHRQSVTVVEPRQRRYLNKLGLSFTDLFKDRDGLTTQVVANFANPEILAEYAAARKEVENIVERLIERTSDVDITAAAALTKRSKKIVHHFDAALKKFERSQLERNEVVSRRLSALFAHLLPNGGLQERTLTAATLINAYGPAVLDEIFAAIEPTCVDHVLLDL